MHVRVGERDAQEIVGKIDSHVREVEGDVQMRGDKIACMSRYENEPMQLVKGTGTHA
jgi:hypothetical protein